MRSMLLPVVERRARARLLAATDDGADWLACPRPISLRQGHRSCARISLAEEEGGSSQKLSVSDPGCESHRRRRRPPRRKRVFCTPVLAKLLAAWKLSHWERLYGQAPGMDDLIVPTRGQPRQRVGCRTRLDRGSRAARPADGGRQDKIVSEEVTTCGRGSSRRAGSTAPIVTSSACVPTVTATTSRTATRGRRGPRCVPRSQCSRSRFLEPRYSRLAQPI
jgi:hypothetical protein